MSHIEFCHAALWPELDVQYVSVTEQWAQMAIAGPHARDVLAKIVDDLDLGNDAFPFMAARNITILEGMPARLFRISFSGELAYELAVPADYGRAAWAGIMAAGDEFGILPYGLEALGIMRIEKGHPAGPELDGRTTAADLGMARMMSGAKDYVGRTLAGRPAFNESDRPQLVGFKPVDKQQKMVAGSHILQLGEQAIAANDQGWVSSASYSPMLECWIGLGFVNGGRDRHGEIARALDMLHDKDIEVEIVSPVFYDPEGAKLHG